MKLIGTYLDGLYSENKLLSTFLNNYNLRYVELEKFEKRFGTMSKEELARFIQDPENAYDLAKFGHESENYIMSNASLVTFLCTGRVGVYDEGHNEFQEEF